MFPLILAVLDRDYSSTSSRFRAASIRGNIPNLGFSRADLNIHTHNLGNLPRRLHMNQNPKPCTLIDRHTSSVDHGGGICLGAVGGCGVQGIAAQASCMLKTLTNPQTLTLNPLSPKP